MTPPPKAEMDYRFWVSLILYTALTAKEVCNIPFNPLGFLMCFDALFSEVQQPATSVVDCAATMPS